MHRYTDRSDADAVAVFVELHGEEDVSDKRPATAHVEQHFIKGRRETPRPITDIDEHAYTRGELVADSVEGVHADREYNAMSMQQRWHDCDIDGQPAVLLENDPHGKADGKLVRHRRRLSISARNQRQRDPNVATNGTALRGGVRWPQHDNGNERQCRPTG